MAVDITNPTYRSHHDTTDVSWPKCHRCSERLSGQKLSPITDPTSAELVAKGLGRVYPVESCMVVGRERAKSLRHKYEVIVEVKCHGETMRFTLAIPHWYTQAHEHVAMGKTWCFMHGLNEAGKLSYKTKTGKVA